MVHIMSAMSNEYKSCIICRKTISRTSEYGNEITNKRYERKQTCSKSCAAILSRKLHPKPFLDKFCEICDSKIFPAPSDNQSRHSNKRVCSRKCVGILTNQERISKGWKPWNTGKTGIVSGAKNPNWKGGISDKMNLLRQSNEYVKWRNLVFVRDEYTCQNCKQLGGTLHAHHKALVRFYPELIVNVDNGLTLCKSCHHKIHANNTNSDYVDIEVVIKK